MTSLRGLTAALLWHNAPAPPRLPRPAAIVRPAPDEAVLTPVQARLSALTGAVESFQKVDLKNSPEGALSAAGEAQMLRALGGRDVQSAAPVASSNEAPILPLEAPRPPPIRGHPPVYLLSRPLEESVAIRPSLTALHAGATLAWEAWKAATVFSMLGWKAGVPIAVWEAAVLPAVVTARTLGMLGALYWERKLAVLGRIARAPGVDRLRVLTTSDAEFWGPLALRLENRGMIFVESADGLPAEVGAYGAPIALGDASGWRLKLTLMKGERALGSDWTPSLRDLDAKQPIPEEAAAAWRAALKADARAETRLQRVVDLERSKQLRLEAVLLDPTGAERQRGALAYAKKARAMIGLGKINRLRAFLGMARRPHSIGLWNSAVERPGTPREKGFKAALARAWARVSGRLIVAPPEEKR